MTDEDSTWVWAQNSDTLQVQRVQRGMTHPGSGWRELTPAQASFELKEMRDQ